MAVSLQEQRFGAQLAKACEMRLLVAYSEDRKIGDSFDSTSRALFAGKRPSSVQAAVRVDQYPSNVRSVALSARTDRAD